MYVCARVCEMAIICVYDYVSVATDCKNSTNSAHLKTNKQAGGVYVAALSIMYGGELVKPAYQL